VRVTVVNSGQGLDLCGRRSVAGAEGWYYPPPAAPHAHGIKILSPAGLALEPNLGPKVAFWASLGRVPNVARVFGPINDEQGRPVGAELEHVHDALPLEEYTSPARRPSLPDASRVGERLFTALATLHRRNAVLRDIHPGNALYRERDGEPVFIDTLSAQVFARVGGVSKTLPAPVVKTNFAPAELQGVPDFSAVRATVAGDVFSAALCVALLILPNNPFAVRNPAGRILRSEDAIKGGANCFRSPAGFTPVVDRAAVDRLPAELRDALEAALSAEAARRPTPAELAGAFGRYARPAAAVPVSVPTPLPTPRRYHPPRAWPAAAACVFIALGLTAGLTLHGGDPPAPELPAPTAPTTAAPKAAPLPSPIAPGAPAAPPSAPRAAQRPDTRTLWENAYDRP
jgi:hypothetical protein